MKRKFDHPAQSGPPTMWRSLAELEGSPAFDEVLQREFPREAATYQEGGLSKRDFLKLMGASLALAGLAGCRRPEAYMVPFNQDVESQIPGKFLYYATAMPLRDGAMPLIATTVDGRPTKLEGNPLHPFSNGGTDAFAQASLLDLYDPHRAKAMKEHGTEATPAAFERYLQKLAQDRAEGLAFLVERKNSPTRDRLRAELEARFPQLLWCEYEPLGGDARATEAAAFGAGVRVVPKFERADIILALDSDFLNATDQGVGYAAGFFARRNPDQKGAPMNRLYVVENHFTTTGGMADHRYRCKASLIGEFACLLAEKLAIADLSAVLAKCPRVKAEFDDAWISACAADLLAHRGRSMVTVGALQPAWVHSLVFAINAALGNLNATLLGVTTDEMPAHSIGELADAIKAGAVKALFILGGNPVYNAPADLGFSDLLARVSDVIHLAPFEDETARFARWFIPAAHYLESWGDVRAFDGTYSVIQPMILPLWNGLSELEILAQLCGQPKPAGPELVQATLSTRGGDWGSVLRSGFQPSSQWPATELRFKPSMLESAPPAPGLELVFLQSSSVDDGRYANNSWLQETPDFETKVTWDNVALLSPATAARLGIRANNFGGTDRVAEKLGTEIDHDIVADLVELTAGSVTVTAAALVAPGHADDSVSLALGYGRQGVSALLENVGFDAYPLRTADSMRFRTGVQVKVTGETYPLARTQEHRSMEGRDLFREGTLGRYERDATFAGAMDLEEPASTQPLYPSPPLTAPEQWGMAIDLNICFGCNACVVACQAENNVPVVGKDQVRRNRDMAWIRIDRYFAGEAENPEMLAQAVMCQHCESAPCETVCPVNATVHSEEGLNLMAYNRCIGTRYCANNCPWKVRRFNFFDYNQRPLDQLYWGPLAEKGMADSLKMVKNPNVTVRMRGVMEKCTFCIQRIEEAKIARLVEAGPRNKNEVPIRAFKTACQQACPSEAIVFGNINDPQSRVARLRQSPRGYVTLKYLNTKPRVTYLARIKNPNPRMPDAARVGTANGEEPHA